MDPSTMDYMMHPQEHSNPSSSSASVDHAARSACPALRAAAAAEHNQQHPPPMFPSRPNYYLDPVHNNPHFWQTLPPPHARWNTDPLYHPSPPILPMATGQMNQPPYQSNGPSLYNPHGNPPQFRYRAPMVSLQRIGGTAPIQHSQGGFSGSNQGQQPQAGIAGETGHSASVHGSRTTLPSLTSMPPTTAGQNLQTTFPQTSHPAQQSSQHNPHFTRHTSMPSPFTTSDANAPSGGQTDYGSSSNSASSSPNHRAPGGPQTGDMSNETASSEPRRASATRNRRTIPRLPSESGWSSDDDSEPDAATFSFLEAAVGNAPNLDNASDDRLRAHQLIRGAMSSKRVASKKAITSLESVTISNLPENERTCVICYNDYGAETPEGICENPLRLPKCKHVFGDHCIKKWFEESDSCPYCRDKVPSEPQHRNSVNAHSVYRFLRQHHQAAMQMQQMRSAREHERSEPDAPGRPADNTLGGLAALTSSPFSDFEYTALSGASARRQDNPPMYNSRTPAWHGNFGDRHSPLPFGEAGDGRRRVRPRHGSLRGFPSGRPHFSSNGAAAAQYPWLSRPSATHLHTRQHSASSSNATARPTFDAHVSSFQFPTQMGGAPPEPYLNPLIVAGSGSNGEDYTTLPHMRSQHASPMSPTYAGPEVYMTNADEPIYGGAMSHQQS
ncbi:hypothetical protein F5Y00DRAFT_90327 [Daldinia vernicosa]|uniref:uncharacterized protein n=1 Tax=Daldinia vernicosa TaxID=114800 RepID=UPI002007AC77|nr:uncharacterized protein F5Y00DRAFT_90327 [Daldinia vernicosa]KAI0848340.1 hypothetical protein F5Y00DRAFT_90327 [Daldinia vernicosa]